MPTRVKTLPPAFVLCLAVAPAVCQDTSTPVQLLNGVPVHRRPGTGQTTPAQSVIRGPVPSWEPIQKTDPEYTAQARLAELEGTVVLSGVIDAVGVAQDLQLIESVGLGLDDKAMDAVKQWHFAPAVNQGAVQISVQFKLATKRSLWHLIRAHFDAPEGTTPPQFVSAPYPFAAELGPEAMEEGSVLVAIGRLAAVQLRFDVDEQGNPEHFQVASASADVWGAEATAVVNRWRFTPGTKNGFPAAVPCTVEFVWGEKELTSDLERQLHYVLTARQAQ